MAIFSYYHSLISFTYICRHSFVKRFFFLFLNSFKLILRGHMVLYVSRVRALQFYIVNTNFITG